MKSLRVSLFSSWSVSYTHLDVYKRQRSHRQLQPLAEMMRVFMVMLCSLMLSLSAFAAELGEPNITEQTTMKELRENPSIKGSGFYT